MNNYLYPIPNNYHQVIIEELKKINTNLQILERKISEQDKKKENNYLEKDDNYYMI